MQLDSAQKQIIKNSQQSVSWFLRNLGKVKHPSAGMLPFFPFNYQKKALGSFRKNRLCIFKKCRQSGISKITGAYALWFAMMHSLKTVLVVSRTDSDAMLFLNDNIRFLFCNLPGWMQEVWAPVKDNEHEIVFPNGSRIRSLSSNQDVLRSNASSLNIIDEAAFIQNMDVMWAAGWPTLQHGGSVIVVSTTNGVGGWYWSTWTDAEAGANDFYPIVVNWWDMDWVIEYKDAASGAPVRLAPTDGLTDCDGRTVLHPTFGEIILDPTKYGPKWSPWLEGQYRGLQEKGETWKFDQEILAQFVGSGNTVLDKNVIAYIETTIKEPIAKITGNQTYVHPVSGEVSTIDFTPSIAGEGLWIWKNPVAAKPAKYRGKELLDPGHPAHVYVAGVDISTGKAKDYHAIEVFDLIEMEQVAEYMGHCLPRVFKLIVDRVARWYNCSLLVVERNNGGDTFIDELRYDLMYPRLWRKRDVDDRPKKTSGGSSLRLADYGFFTSTASKPVLNQFLLNFLRDKPGEGYTIYSRRLHRQLSTYVRKRDKAGKDTGKTEAEDGAGNYDDLVMACGLALIGAPDATVADATSLVPHTHDEFANMYTVTDNPDKFTDTGGQGLLIPTKVLPDLSPEMSIQSQIEQFAMQLGAIPMIDRNAVAPTTPRKYNFGTRSG